MFSINRALIQGNVGKDPVLNSMPNGRAALSLSIATTESWKDKETGKRESRTDWHRVVFYGRLAELVAEYVKQGDLVYVEGLNRTRAYQDKETHTERYITEVIAESFKMWSKKKREAGEEGAEVPTMQGRADEFGEDSVPF